MQPHVKIINFNIVLFNFNRGHQQHLKMYMTFGTFTTATQPN